MNVSILKQEQEQKAGMENIVRGKHSVYDNIQELIPVSRLKPTEAHCQALDVFDQLKLQLEFVHHRFFRVRQGNFYYAFFNQVVEVVVVAHL